MRHIEKNKTESDGFSRWKKRNKGAGWKDFSISSEHRELRNSLITEQLGMCCYCEVIISLDDSHIEHLKPKSIYQREMLSYVNLMASCNRKESCGHKKGRWFSAGMVSPLHGNCERNFEQG